MTDLTSVQLLLTWQPLMSISRTLALLSSACGVQTVCHGFADVAGDVWHTTGKAHGWEHRQQLKAAPQHTPVLKL